EPALAVEKAADFIRPNQSGLGSLNPTTSDAGAPTTGVNTWTLGDFVLEVETPALYEGVLSPAVMRVTLRQERDTRFARVIGADSAGITQEAYCGAFTRIGAGIF
ncbi:MAG: hypothetical protein GTO61_03015, partial [Gemmatimonadales bacterium]|nr:hypothetical protein [Gemmatimonadales bacterium]